MNHLTLAIALNFMIVVESTTTVPVMLTTGLLQWNILQNVQR